MDRALGLFGVPIVRTFGDAAQGLVGGARDTWTDAKNRVQSFRDVADTIKNGEVTGEQVVDAIVNVPSLYTLPIKAVEKITGVPVKEGFRDGVLRDGEIILPPLPY